MEEPAQNWYAVKVFYNKVFEIEEEFSSLGIETYLATDKVPLKGQAHIAARRRMATLKAEGRADHRFIQEGAVIYQRIPMITSLIFARTQEDRVPELESILKDSLGEARGFIYKDAEWKGYAVVPDSQMAAFRLVTAQGSSGLEFFSSDDITRFKEGKKVRVTEGPFRGAEGYVKRIRRDRRLLVSIEGIVAVATAFIEPQFLEEIS